MEFTQQDISWLTIRRGGMETNLFGTLLFTWAKSLFELNPSLQCLCSTRKVFGIHQPLQPTLPCFCPSSQYPDQASGSIHSPSSLTFGQESSKTYSIILLKVDTFAWDYVNVNMRHSLSSLWAILYGKCERGCLMIGFKLMADLLSSKP